MRPFLAGVIVGGVLGAAVALLFAPKSGAETRGLLMTGGGRAAEVAREAAREAKAKARALEEQGERYLGRDEELAWRKIREIREGVQKYSRTVMS